MKEIFISYNFNGGYSNILLKTNANLFKEGEIENIQNKIEQETGNKNPIINNFIIK